MSGPLDPLLVFRPTVMTSGIFTGSRSIPISTKASFVGSGAGLGIPFQNTARTSIVRHPPPSFFNNYPHPSPTPGPLVVAKSGPRSALAAASFGDINMIEEIANT